MSRTRKVASPTNAKIGIQTYLSKAPGTGGQIKTEPKDFLVEEITPAGIVLEIDNSQKFSDEDGGEFTHFTLQKENWDTMRALKMISNKVGVSQKRFKFAGTKDRRAISTQRVSAWNVPIEKLEKINLKDIAIRDFSVGSEPINLGSLLGNRFTITINCVAPDSDKLVKKAVSELGGVVPNFYGSQRFGSRMNNHIIGAHLLKGEFSEAVTAYLCDTGGEPEEATIARDALRKTMDYKQALLDFPNYLGFEKSMLNHLIKVPTDNVGALRMLPKKLRWMFVHAYQGYIFNMLLSDDIKGGKLSADLPLVGYATKPDSRTKKLLEIDGLTVDDFKVSSMPELTSEGLSRSATVPFSDFEVVEYDKENRMIRLRFSLPPGSYATIFLSEIMK